MNPHMNLRRGLRYASAFRARRPVFACSRAEQFMFVAHDKPLDSWTRSFAAKIRHGPFLAAARVLK